LPFMRLLEGDRPWNEERIPLVSRAQPADSTFGTLGRYQLAGRRLYSRNLMMVSVLRRVKSSGLLSEYNNLGAYVARGEARPAYERAFIAQLALYKPRSG
jgi:glutathione S-transferase